jgi:D-alanyl-lipoteichoic acid acyltransferase DltB (MBOAT superfamily)
LLVTSLGVNLGLLGYFKYAAFVTRNFARFLGALGIPFSPAELDVILPIGISFYTFQTLSYTLDIYFGKGKPWGSFLDYALYVTFFPQLVAGPIVRAFQFLPQCEEPRRASSRQLSWGLTLLLVGLFQKIAIADGLLAPIADHVYRAKSFGPLGAWLGTVAFAGQIFCDFAGYSTCAIGAALCLGFALPDNFRCPYASIGFSDFWRRWHISLSTWLRDYLYIPLGGNRRGALRTFGNLMTTMLLGGLWHGASWHFVAWGVLHGFYLVAERLLRGIAPASAVWGKPVVRFLLGLGTFGLVCVAWVFFRASSMQQALVILPAMFGFSSHDGLPLLTSGATIVVVVTTAAILCIQWALRDSSLEAAASRCPAYLRVLLLAAMLAATLSMSGTDRAFIYFQF